MTKDVTVTGGVTAVGEIAVYEGDGATPLTSIAFSNFTGLQASVREYWFMINNTGPLPVEVYWNISSSTLSPWIPTSSGYTYQEDSVDKYQIYLMEWPSANHWSPNDWTTPENVSFAVGEGRGMHIKCFYTGYPNTAELFTFTMSFYAQDA